MDTIFKKRTFSEKFSYVFDWVQMHRNPLLKYYTLLFMPLCVLQAFGFVSILKAQASFDPNNLSMDTLGGDMGTMSVYYLLAIACSFLGASLFYALYAISEQLHKPLHDTSFGFVWKQMKKNMGKLFLCGVVVGLFATLLGVFVFILSLMTPWTLIATLPITAAICVALIPFLPLYLLNDEPVFEALAHSMKLGFKSWWGFFSTAFVMSIMVYLIQLTVTLPLYACISLDTIFGTGEGLWGNVVYVITILLGALVCFTNCLLTPLTYLTGIAQYGHAANKHENTLNFENIDMEMAAQAAHETR